MKKIFFLNILLLQGLILAAQHCPWDCSGIILLQTTLSKDELYTLHPLLTDENESEIIDTVYGTGLDTRDACTFLSYEDFTAYRTKRTELHHWYGYDTFYHFAQGLFIVKFNFCEYEDRKLYLRFTDPHTAGLTFHYIEIPGSQRIHLHNYSNELFTGKMKEIRKEIEPFIFIVSCDAFLLWKEECGN